MIPGQYLLNRSICFLRVFWTVRKEVCNVPYLFSAPDTVHKWAANANEANANLTNLGESGITDVLILSHNDSFLFNDKAVQICT